MNERAPHFAFRSPAAVLGVVVALGVGAAPRLAAERMPTLPTGQGVMLCASCKPPADLSWRVSLAATGEPGEPLVISGTIFRPDGVTPASGVVLFIYQTDATGHYNTKDDPFDPRLRGWMKTRPDGRYEFRTVRPAPYPGRTIPAHIHAHLYGPELPEYFIDDFWFEGDPFVTPAEKAKLTGRGGFPSILRLTRDSDGVLRGVRNIRVERLSP